MLDGWHRAGHWGVTVKRIFVICAAFALVVAACGQAPSGGGATNSPAAAASPVRGGTAIIAIWQEPTTLLPLYRNQTVATVVGNGVVEGLVRTKADGTYEGDLAKNVPTLGNGVTVTGNRMEVRWELKPDVKWSDGEPFTSADIKFTWERWMADAKVNTRAGFSDIEAIDTPDALTAIVKYKAIYPPYLDNFFGPLPKHLYEKEADLSKTDYNRKHVGTGPYKVADFKVGESITLERNTNYRETGKQYLEKIIFKSVPSSQVAIAQLKAGEVQGMWNLLESEMLDLEKETGIAVQADRSPSVERIELNTAVNKDMTEPNSTHPVLGDIEMRKALLYATPKQTMIDKLLAGKVKPANSPVSLGWAAPQNIVQEGYDAKKANDALDKAGWVKGSDGIRSKAGARAALTITTTTGNQTRERIEQVLIDEYKAIGVELKIQNMPSATLLSASWSSGDPRKRGSFDLVMYGSSPGIDPGTVVTQRYYSKNIPSAANNGVGQNYTRVKNADLDKAIDDSNATLDQEKRKEAYGRALKLLNDQYVIIWLYDRADIDGRRTELQGWKENPWQEFTDNMEEWFLKKT
jgi:peptide/nickel transport system substrate-binding protein